MAQSEVDGDNEDERWGDTDDVSTDDDELYFDEEEFSEVSLGHLTKFLAVAA
jgi:hypothetical protein